MEEAAQARPPGLDSRSSALRQLHVLRDPPLDGPTNMARDEHLLHGEEWRPAALRLYAWTPPTISLGYFQRRAQWEALSDELRALAVVRRITGGGAILHDREITYCLVLDGSMPLATQPPVALYRFVHECWRVVLVEDGVRPETAADDLPLPTPRSGPFFCFEKPGRTDLVVAGQKLLGSAQRRAAGRVLQHGSLLLGRGFAAHPGASLGDPPTERVERWVQRFAAQVADALGLPRRCGQWGAVQLADVGERRRRYADPGWTWQR